MTIRDAYNNLLIELNKVQAPSLLLDDFIYLFNKGTQKYVNKRYNLFEVKQQLTDDLRVLTKTVEITSPTLSIETGSVFGKSYKCELPSDYLHILNCICTFDTIDKCTGETKTIHKGANKLDTTQWSHVIDNYYMQPSIEQPYYYIINISNPIKSGLSDDIKKQNTSRGSEQRYGNSVLPIMQIKCGDDSRYTLKSVFIDYLRTPEYLSLDQNLLDEITDKSQVIEFPDYVVYEIIDEIVILILENSSNPRIQTYPQISQSIA